MYSDVKSFLQSVWYARAEIDRLSDSVKELETQAMKMTASLTGMPRGGNADAQALWARIIDDTDKLYARQTFYYEHLKHVEAFIDLIPQDKYREVLKLRYVNCMTWPEVARRLESVGYYYEIRQVFRLHGAALEEARKLWETEKWKYECTDKEE